MEHRKQNSAALQDKLIHFDMCHCFLSRQEALLAAISEKDANIALLELSSSKKKKTQEEVAALKREKDSLVQQLKQQVRLNTKHQGGLFAQVLRKASRRRDDT